MDAQVMDAESLYRAGVQCAEQAWRLQNPLMLQQALALAHASVSTTARDDPRLSKRLGSLGRNFQYLFELTSDPRALGEAIRLTRSALALVQDTQDSSLWLNNLSTQLAYRYEEQGNPQDLTESIDNARQAAELVSDSDPNRPVVLSNLAAQLATRFSDSQDANHLQDLDDAIGYAQQAVDLTSPNQPHLAGLLINLGRLFEYRFQHTRKPEHLDESIRTTLKAKDLLQPGDRHQALLYSNLSNQLEYRFEVLGRIEDLDQSIVFARLALADEHTPRYHHDRARRLTVLSEQLVLQYERLGRQDDNKDLHSLDEAIKLTEEAREVLTEGDRSGQSIFLASIVGNLDRYYAFRAERTCCPKCSKAACAGSLMDYNPEDDWAKGFKFAQRALELTPRAHADFPKRLMNLANHHHERFKREGKTEDQDEAVSKAQEAADLLGSEHPGLAATQINLAAHLLSRCSHSRTHEDFQTALGLLLKASKSVNAQPVIRVRAARHAISLLIQLENWTEARTVSREALRLLPLVNSRSLKLTDQEHALKGFAGFAAAACALSLQADDVCGAVELLEIGRGAILSNIMDSRSDITDLRAVLPDLAAEFEELRGEINAPYDHSRHDDMVQWINRHIEADKELEKCIQTIRNSPGFERFLLGPSSFEIMRLAGDGVIAIVNITGFRSDAILITKFGMKAIHLPCLTSIELWEWEPRTLTVWNVPTIGEKNTRYRKFQSWLWSKCVGPIMEAIENSGLQQLPVQVCWIGSGAASILPFHAADGSAESNRPNDRENTFDRAISSYIPSLKVLSYARERTASSRAIHTADDPDGLIDNLSASTLRDELGKPKLLIITMPTTLDSKAFRPLSAQQEAERIISATGNAVFSETLTQPSAAEVVNRMPSYDVVHFVCHGVSDKEDPANSHLVLQKTQEPDGLLVQDNLTVEEISKVDLRRAHIAYLSACSTAENKVDPLADEVLHISSGFQVAGFAHVIGSLWMTSDRDGIGVAQGFYEQLISLHGTVSEGAVALALHKSVATLRKTKRKAPLAWAPFIHLGV
ncbi:hypothetical protein H2201_009035 [Coniosporium apollinis]|uniref:CHAT domain-containing protein n=1 Tax=Coniosporium apollinis TaxID=61459 RepID=A0ABQ9NGP6_9PEZI|nr:hypothetical protein H2201_009035 [Coniosporium apollinis]